jgi:hypothetical protein
VIRSAIESGLASASAAFHSNDLAYLALTSKVENPLRDALALDLHASLGQTEFLVAREWKKQGVPSRTDIAILAGDSPAALIECKASGSYDAFGKPKPYPMTDVVKDIEKAHSASDPNTEIFVLLFVTHADRIVEERLYNVVKYWGRINRSIENRGSASAVRNGAQTRYSEAFSGDAFGPVTTGEIDAGEAFGIPVTIDYWLAELNKPFHT